jgi:hypothetical protein
VIGSIFAANELMKPIVRYAFRTGLPPLHTSSICLIFATGKDTNVQNVSVKRNGTRSRASELTLANDTPNVFRQVARDVAASPATEVFTKDYSAAGQSSAECMILEQWCPRNRYRPDSDQLGLSGSRHLR